jgi:hypothetical protein
LFRSEELTPFLVPKGVFGTLIKERLLLNARGAVPSRGKLKTAGESAGSVALSGGIGRKK